MRPLCLTICAAATLLMCIFAGIGTAQQAASKRATSDEATQPELEKRGSGNSKAALLEFADLDGQRRWPLQMGDAKATAIIFVLQDCPISNKYAPEIQRLADQFTKQRVRFYLVHVDPQLTLKVARQHAKDYGYTLPILIDRKHELVRHCKATTAPEVVVFGGEENLLYRGRIDDRYAAVGKPRQLVKRQDLRLALEAIVTGKPIEVAETKPIGCYIPDLDDD
jgi:hypothetical protein